MEEETESELAEDISKVQMNGANIQDCGHERSTDFTSLLHRCWQSKPSSGVTGYQQVNCFINCVS